MGVPPLGANGSRWQRRLLQGAAATKWATVSPERRALAGGRLQAETAATRYPHVGRRKMVRLRTACLDLLRTDGFVATHSGDEARVSTPPNRSKV
jgi:hypothetical protein